MCQCVCRVGFVLAGRETLSISESYSWKSGSRTFNCWQVYADSELNSLIRVSLFIDLQVKSLLLNIKEKILKYLNTKRLSVALKHVNIKS